MASCDPSRCAFCIEASRIECIALRRLQDAKKTKSHHYFFWVTHASTVLMSHYDKHEALCKGKIFQDVLKLVASCLKEDYDDLLHDAADVNETCFVFYCMSRITQLLEDTCDDEVLKGMLCCVTGDEDNPEISKEAEKSAGNEEASDIVSVALSSSLEPSGETAELIKGLVEIEPETKTKLDVGAAFLISGPVALKSETLPYDLECWCSTATREELVKRVRELSFK